MSFMGLFELFRRPANESKTDRGSQVYQAQEAGLQLPTETNNSPEPSFANCPDILTAKLFFESAPNVNGLEILNDLRKKHTDATIDKVNNILVFSLPCNNAATYATAKLCILVSGNMEIQPLPNEAFRQNWHWREAASKIRFCKYEILITEKSLPNVAYKQRVTVFSDFLTSVIKSVKPSVVYSKNAEKLLDPEDVIACNFGTEADMLHPISNIRMFKISDSAEGTLLMDTIGMNALGLPDIEIVFNDRNPAKMGELLLRYSNFIFDIGDNIRDGEYLEGTTPTERWRCEKRNSMLLPDRYVLHLAPDAEN